MTARGARRLGPLGLGNDGAGTLEDDFMTWKDAALAQIASCLGLEQVERTYESSYTAEELARIPDCWKPL
jgi:NADPH-ferrihemoprotein reductase